MDRILPLFFSVLSAVGAIVCIVTALRWRTIYRGFRPSNELRVYGKLVEFQRHPKVYRGRHGNETPTDIWDFSYTYEVNGKTYTSKNRLVQNNLRVPSGTEIVCQRSDPSQCYIPGLTNPPGDEDHHPLYFAAGLCFAGMLWFLSILP